MRVIKIVLGLCAVKFHDSFLAFRHKLFCHGLMNDCVSFLLCTC